MTLIRRFENTNFTREKLTLSEEEKTDTRSLIENINVKHRILKGYIQSLIKSKYVIPLELLGNLFLFLHLQFNNRQ